MLMLLTWMLHHPSMILANLVMCVNRMYYLFESMKFLFKKKLGFPNFKKKILGCKLHYVKK